MDALTSIVTESREHHHPGSDPGLQRVHPGHAARCQVARVRLDQLREAGIREGGRLGADSRQRVHGPRVHSEEPRDVHGAEPRLGEVVAGGVGRHRRLGQGGVGGPGGGRLGPRAVDGAPGAGRLRGSAIAVRRPLVHMVSQECLDAEVFGFLQVGGHSVHPESVMLPRET